jgi:hypothetical protein
MEIVELFINNPVNAKLDLMGQFPIALQYSVADIRDISKRNAAYSKTIILPGSKNNNYWFGNLFDVNSDFTAFNPNKKTTAKILVNGEAVIDGFLQLRKINKEILQDDEGESIMYECVIYNNFVDLMTELGEKTLYQLPLDEFDHVYNPLSVTSSWTHTWEQGYVYPMLGTHLQQNQYNLDYFYPATFYKMIFDKIVTSAGFGWTGSFKSNAQFEKEIITFIRDGNVFIDETEKNRRKFRASSTDGATAFAGNLPNQAGSYQIGTGNVIPYNDDTTSPNFDNGPDSWDVVNWEWDVDRNGTYDVNYKTSFTFSVANPTANLATNPLKPNATNYGIAITARPRLQRWNGTQWVTLAFGPIIQTNSPISGQSYTLPDSIAAGSSYSLYFDFPEQTFQGIQLLENEKVRVVVRLDKVGPPNASGYSNPVQTGGYYLGQISSSSFVPIIMPITLTFNKAGNYIFNDAYTTEVVQGDTLELGTFLPDKIKQKDLISDLIKRYNLYIQIDPNNERLLVIDERPNFYKNEPLIDWTYKKDHSQKEDIQLLSELQFKSMLFTWTEDDDLYNKEYRDITGDVYGQYEYIFDNDFVKGQKEIKSPFSPTPIVKTQFDAYVAAIDPIDPKVKPRILYWGGLKSYGSNWVMNYADFVAGITVSSTFTQYPYAGHWDDPITPTLDINFWEPKFIYYNEWEQIPVNNMYNTYWADYIKQIEGGRLVTAYFDLNEIDIRFVKNNFNAKIFIKDSYYYVNKIIDYKPLTNETTKVELIKIEDGIKWVGNGNAISEPITTPLCPIDMIAKDFRGTFFYVSASGATVSQACCESIGGIYDPVTGSCRVRRRIIRPITVGTLKPVEINGTGNGNGGGIYVGSGNKTIKTSITENDFIRDGRTMIFGDYNEINADNSVVLGGDENLVNSSNSFIAMADENIIDGDKNFILGGGLNNIDGSNNTLINSSGATVSGTGNILINASSVIATESNIMHIGDNLQIDTVEGNISLNGEPISNSDPGTSDRWILEYTDTTNPTGTGNFTINSPTFSSVTVLKIKPISASGVDWDTYFNSLLTNINNGSILTIKIADVLDRNNYVLLDVANGAFAAFGYQFNISSVEINSGAPIIERKYIIEFLLDISQDLESVLAVGNTATVPILLADGTVTVPSFAFASAPNTGIYRNSVGDLAISKLGVVIAYARTNQWVVRGDNTPTAPRLTFDTDNDTGIYRPGADRVGIAAGGLLVGSFGTNEFQNILLNGVIRISSDANRLYIQAGTQAVSNSGTILNIGPYASTNFAVRFDTVNNRTLIPDGTFGTPSFTFNSDTDTGIYRPAADQVGISTGGALRLRVDNDGAKFLTGSVAAPSISFLSTQVSGISATNIGDIITISTNAASRFLVSNTYIRSVMAHRFADGSVTGPSLNFHSDTDTGIYRPGADQLGIAAGGLVVGIFGTNSLTATVPILLEDGSAAVPAYSFTSDPNTGFFRSGEGTTQISSNGSVRIVAGPSEIRSFGVAHRFFDGSAAAPSISFYNDTNCGLFRSSEDIIALVTNGQSRLILANSYVRSVTTHRIVDGSVTSPSLCFHSDGNTGLYRVAEDELGITTGGAVRAIFKNSGVEFSNGIQLKSPDTTLWQISVDNSGNLTASAIS